MTLGLCWAGHDFSAMQVAPRLRCLYLATRHSNVWSDGEWSERGLLRFQERAPHVIICHTFDPAPLPDWRSLVT